jgi:hypothetical protein
MSVPIRQKKNFVSITKTDLLYIEITVYSEHTTEHANFVWINA